MVVDKVRIEKEAKEILDKFAKALEKIEKEEREEAYVDRGDFERIEKDGEIYNSNFKEKMLANASSHDEEFIIGEKGSWKWLRK